MAELTLSIELGQGPEDVLVCADGTVLTGVEDGRILRVSADLQTVESVADTGGRPLGLEFLPDGRVVICDSDRGLLALDLSTGALAEYAQNPPPFCNNAAVAPDGSVYVSSSSTRYAIGKSNRDIVEAWPTGSLWRCARDGQCKQLLDRLYFANGVAMAADGQSLLVAETGAARVQRYWVEGPKARQSEVVLSEMEALPDNLSVGSDGQVWMALVAPAGAVRKVWTLPFVLRWGIARLVGNSAPDRVQVMAMEEDGQVSRQIDLTGAGYGFVTGVREHNGAIFLGSVAQQRIARLIPD